jgi:hypothetical protein
MFWPLGNTEVIINEKSTLKGQSHEKVYEFVTWDDSFGLN